MAMPEFIRNVEGGSIQPNWLNPATVAGLLDTDFTGMPTERRAELYRAVERFRAIAEAGSVSSGQTAEARAALDRILGILQPYRTSESQTIRETVWKALGDENVRDRIPTFDYELARSWIDTPVVWVWLVLRDGEQIGTKPVRELLGRVRRAIRDQFHEADIERRPNIGVRMESEVKELTARGAA